MSKKSALYEEVIEVVRQKRATLLAEIFDLKKEIKGLEKEVAEADALIEQLDGTKEAAPEAPETPSKPPGSVPVPEVPETLATPERPSEEAPRAPSVEKRPRRRDPGGEPMRAGKTLTEWRSCASEFAALRRPFTVAELANRMELELSKTNLQLTRDAIRLIPEIEEVSKPGLKAKKYALKKPVVVSGPEGLAKAQAAWDARHQRDSVAPRVEKVERGAVVAGTGQRSPLNGLPKELRDLIAPALAAGWAVGTTGSGHVRVRHPKDRGRFFTISSTPSDWRTLENLKSQMRGVGAPLAQ